MATIWTRSEKELTVDDKISIFLQDRTKIKDPVVIGSISMIKNPLGILDTNTDSLEKRLQTIREFVPDDTEGLHFEATDVYFAGVYSGQRVYFVSGYPYVVNKNRNRTCPFVKAALEPYNDASQLFYLEDALSFDEEYASQRELNRTWIPVYEPNGNQIGVLRPSYVQNFIDQDEAELPSSLRIKLREDIKQAKGKPGMYKIKGKILGIQEDESFGDIDKLFGRAADVSHEDIKFKIGYAKNKNFDIIPHVKKETERPVEDIAKAKTVVTPASHRGFDKSYIYLPGAALVAIGIGLIPLLYLRGCDFRGGFKLSEPGWIWQDEKIRYSKDTETAEKSKEAAEKPAEKIIENPEAKARSLEEAVKSDKTVMKKEPVSRKKDDTKIKIEPVPGREARVRPAVKRAPRVRTAVDIEAPDDTAKTKAPASEGEYTYLPPVREGDPFYEEFRDSVDSYLNECVNSGKAGTSGAFTYSYLANIHGKVTRAVVSESDPRTQIPTRCAEGLREIMERQTLETASDGIYTSTEIIELGGVE